MGVALTKSAVQPHAKLHKLQAQVALLNQQLKKVAATAYEEKYFLVGLLEGMRDEIAAQAEKFERLKAAAEAGGTLLLRCHIMPAMLRWLIRSSSLGFSPKGCVSI
jgi:hypothetical protein